MAILLSITCLCGAAAQTVEARPPFAAAVDDAPSLAPIPITVCHCTTCRTTSGVLFASYCPVQPPANSGTVTSLLSAYASSPATTRYFCRVCGCHVFRAQQHLSTTLWEVATGTIVNEVRDDAEADADADTRPVMEYTRHAHVSDTVDGGLSGWLPLLPGRPMHGLANTRTADSALDCTAKAACHCGAINFRVRPPDYDFTASQQPRSGFSDLLVPFAASDPALVANPDDVKWWLRPPQHAPADKSDQNDQSTTPTRYLAGACACQSCRLATGFEIQTWAFVPRLNILLPDGSPVDFANTRHHPATAIRHLATYQSSPGVYRNFCSRCGATVFWHDRWRPDLIDVSAGLFHADRGSRLDWLLDWCTSRVSFAEEATRGRRMLSAQRGKGLVQCLQDGMKSHVS